MNCAPILRAVAFSALIAGCSEDRATATAAPVYDLDVAPIVLSVAGKIYNYVSGTTRVFELNDGGTKSALSK